MRSFPHLIWASLSSQGTCTVGTSPSSPSPCSNALCPSFCLFSVLLISGAATARSCTVLAFREQLFRLGVVCLCIGNENTLECVRLQCSGNVDLIYTLQGHPSKSRRNCEVRSELFNFNISIERQSRGKRGLGEEDCIPNKYCNLASRIF